MDDSADDNLCARSGSSVLLDVNNGDRLVFARLLSSSTIKIGNNRCSLSPLIGSPYGSVFELQTGRIGRCFVKSQRAWNGNSTPAESSQPRDNRALVDDNTAQTLSSEDIDHLRKEGTSGKDIVDALVANSKTYHSKTVFSQEKYVKKKQKKYAPRLVIHRPSARRVCEAYYVKSPQKIGFLRMDTLGLMLSLANVGAHAEVLVMDSLGGLLTAAAAERIEGFGSVCNVYYSQKPAAMHIVGLLNLTDAAASRIFQASLSELTEAIESGVLKAENLTNQLECDADTVSAETEIIPSVEHKHAELELLAMDVDNSACDGDGLVVENVASKNAQGAVRRGRRATAADVIVWVKHGFTSLLVGVPEAHPSSVAEELLKLLSPSAPFVIYHPYLQPLAECMHQLQTSKLAVALEIVEPWLREYQVLPSRTHPHMQMHGNGGYVLTGIKIAM